jgi:hypothetical protein
MPILHADVNTQRASRYLVQFCKHAAAMGDGGHTARMHLHTTLARREVQVTADWSDTNGTVTFDPWGQCTLAAEGDTLTLRIDAADENGLSQLRDVIDRDLQRFSRRDPLAVTWQRPDPGPPKGAVTGAPRRRFARRNLQVILFALATALVVAGHVGLIGTVVARSRWTGMAVDVLAALVALKIALIAWAHLAARRRAAKPPPTPTEEQ